MNNEHLAQLAADRLADERQLRGTVAFAAKIIAKVSEIHRRMRCATLTKTGTHHERRPNDHRRSG